MEARQGDVVGNRGRQGQQRSSNIRDTRAYGRALLHFLARADEKETRIPKEEDRGISLAWQLYMG